ncbi:MAG: adenylate/guanylate cyclase domain-containing protein [Bdellovibrionota bacterium]
MFKNINKVGFHLAIASLVIACLACLVSWNRTFSELENALWDIRVKLTADPNKADKSIKVITISQRSLDHFAKDSITWPWPRPLYIPVIEFLRDAGAKGLAFDMLFTETSVHGAVDDTQFAEAMLGELPIVNAVSLSRTAKEVEQEYEYKSFIKRQQENLSKLKLKHKTFQYRSATLPIRDILKYAAAFGSVNATPDPDGVFRRYPFLLSLDETPVLSLPFALYHSVENQLPLIQDPRNTGEDLLVKFHGPAGTYQTIDFLDVISSYLSLQAGEKPRLDPKIFKDAWVFLGVWAPGLLDLRPISLDEKYRGVEFLATVLDNILHDDFIQRTQPLSDLFLIIMLSTIATLVFAFTKSISRQIIWFIIFAVTCSLIALVLAEYGVWIDYSSPMLALIFIAASSLSIHYYHEGKQHKFIKDAFGHYVNKEVIKKIVSDPDKLSLGGEKRNLTIFFSDLAGFTSISESMEPTQLTKLLNEYLTEMTDIVLASGGTLDKYEGDAIIAFWNAPLSVEKHEQKAVQAALDCQRKLASLRESFSNQYGVELRMRIGINTGEVVVGNFGSKSRFNYTMIGDAVNLAARLEGVNKQFGTETLISAATATTLDNSILVRKIADIRVVGRKEPVGIYEPIDLSHQNQEETIALFEKCRLDFEKGNFKEAERGFESIKDDPVSEIYLKRLRTLKSQDMESWSAVWNLSEK